MLRAATVLSLRSPRVQALATLGPQAAALPQRVAQGLTVCGVGMFVFFVLGAFALVEPITAWYTRVMDFIIGLGAIQVRVGDGVLFGLVIAASVLLSKLVRFLLAVAVYTKAHVPLGRAEAFSKLVHYGLLCVGVFVAMSASGVELTKFTVLAGALGVGLGFGLQNIVNNFVSGLILLLYQYR